jgi:hypothetical protein
MKANNFTGTNKEINNWIPFEPNNFERVEKLAFKFKYIFKEGN